MWPHHAPRRGSALVVTVGLLAVLAVAGFGFAVVMRLHYNTSRYYSASSDVDLLSSAAIYYAVHDVRYGQANARPADWKDNDLDEWHSRPAGAIDEPADSPLCPWYVDSSLVTDLVEDTDYPPVKRHYPLHANSYAMVHDVLGDRVALTYVRVLDAASKINLNDDNGRLDAILDTLIGELELNTVVDASPGAGNELTGNAITTFRDALPGQRLSTLRQLTEKLTSGAPRIKGMTERRFDVLQHFVTIYSWPHEPASYPSFSPSTIKPAGDGGLSHAADSRSSPINVNTAPAPVLVAIMANAKAADGSRVGVVTARKVANWILRTRDPENPDYWEDMDSRGDGFDADVWQKWLTTYDYTTYVRAPGTDRYKGYASGYRCYPLGVFHTVNHVMALVHGLTDPATPASAAAVDNTDPFPEVITEAEANAIIAAISPNPLPSTVPHDANHMSYTRLSGKLTGVLRVLGPRNMPRNKAAQDPECAPEPIGLNDLDTAGYTIPVTFSAMGRFEITSRTHAFLKADYGRVDSANDFSLTGDDTSKRWGVGPPQWRGYSVLIYHGTGKGQLRGIVKNTSRTLTVPKWSTTPDDTSCYYICGPGPMLDRVDMDDQGTRLDRIDVVNNGAFLTDDDATWEDDQWNGYRVLVYRAGYTTESIGGGKTIANERIAEKTVQERTIVDTEGGATPRLVLSPQLDDYEYSSTYHWSYIILGSHGSTTHQAAVKAYDVIHHTTQKDFAGSGTDIAVGPNPEGVTASNTDGFIVVAKKPVARTGTMPSDFFLHNFLNSLSPNQGGARLGGGGATIADLVSGGGNLAIDGFYIGRRQANKYIEFSTTTSPIVTSSPTDGGFVSFWFRADHDCMVSGDAIPTRTIIRIKGKGPTTAGGEDYDDLRVIMGWNDEGHPCIKVVLRALGREFYGKLMGKNAAGALEQIDVYCQQHEQELFEVDVSQVKSIYPDINAPWEAGQWHHIALAWNECVTTVAQARDNDGISDTDRRCDGPPPASAAKYDELDDEMEARVQLWLDGQKCGQYPARRKAFNLVPEGESPETSGVLHVGEAGHPPCGTVDGIIAYAHTSTTLTMSSYVPDARYHDFSVGVQGPASGNYSVYRSPTITLPAGAAYCLGTARWTVHAPAVYFSDVWMSKYSYPTAIEVTLEGVGSSWSMPDIRSGTGYAWLNHSVLGGGGPLRSADNDLSTRIHGASAAISYELRLHAWHGYGTAGKQRGWDNSSKVFIDAPDFYQTPVIEDVTITYLGPVVFYHWR